MPAKKHIVDPRQISAVTQAVAGEDFVRRASAAAAKITHAPISARLAFASGPELSGGIDVEPEDVDPASCTRATKT